jgi:hypothetical protein
MCVGGHVYVCRIEFASISTNFLLNVPPVLSVWNFLFFILFARFYKISFRKLFCVNKIKPCMFVFLR